MKDFLTSTVGSISDFLGTFFFYDILGLPFIVWWLGLGAIFFTVRLGFINISMFSHAIAVVSGKYKEKDAEGEVTPFAALSSAVSATVGLGNIAGVAIAITIGGPGAVIWMVLGGIFGMTSKYAEVLLGHKYRKKDPVTGKISGGAFYYLSEGLAEKGMAKFGKIVAVIFAIFCIAGAFGAANMFQANQSIAALQSAFNLGENADYILAGIMALLAGFVILGSIQRIAKVAKAIVPVMAVSYFICCFVILFSNFSGLGNAISLMFSEAFNFSAATGGAIGAIIAGIRRSAFSNEAGLGSAPIAHAASKTNIPAREGCVALLEPFIDTVIICFLTGLVIVTTGVYETGGKDGILLTAAAFETVHGSFDILLSLIVVMFAFSTLLTWGYYGERAMAWLAGERSVIYYQVAYVALIFVGGVANASEIITLSEILILGMAIPNLIGLYILSNDIAKDTRAYRKSLK